MLSLRAHEKGLEGLIDLALPAIISSRPVWNGKRLANEAFVLENGVVRPLHRKQYFPNEPGWFESEWYSGDRSGFEVAEVLGIKVGVLLCTEAMFNERARAYGRQGASLIVIPRASGVNMGPGKSRERWRRSFRAPTLSVRTGSAVPEVVRSLAEAVSPMLRKGGCSLRRRK